MRLLDIVYGPVDCGVFCQDCYAGRGSFRMEEVIGHTWL